eukprot:CAMPEP_0117420532 /NCGR_PEP_ID=MMETSP0758-20121206/1845_1 /TAXON_ID=63605 /ORGANISM="Percolomonas cosmopolitus, Strain AE-1 (ATCC 50343)" /LENGTH=598 /DNA_ID=CAMNT_0005202193 /DNA_START=1013 /DNA_END=2809 /DNA_ORIENTATION=-
MLGQEIAPSHAIIFNLLICSINDIGVKEAMKVYYKYFRTAEESKLGLGSQRQSNQYLLKIPPKTSIIFDSLLNAASKEFPRARTDEEIHSLQDIVKDIMNEYAYYCGEITFIAKNMLVRMGVDDVNMEVAEVTSLRTIESDVVDPFLYDDYYYVRSDEIAFSVHEFLRIFNLQHFELPRSRKERLLPFILANDHLPDLRAFVLKDYEDYDRIMYGIRHIGNSDRVNYYISVPWVMKMIENNQLVYIDSTTGPQLVEHKWQIWLDYEYRVSNSTHVNKEYLPRLESSFTQEDVDEINEQIKNDSLIVKEDEPRPLYYLKRALKYKYRQPEIDELYKEKNSQVVDALVSIGFSLHKALQVASSKDYAHDFPITKSVLFKVIDDEIRASYAHLFDAVLNDHTDYNVEHGINKFEQSSGPNSELEQLLASQSSPYSKNIDYDSNDTKHLLTLHGSDPSARVSSRISSEKSFYAYAYNIENQESLPEHSEIREMETKVKDDIKLELERSDKLEMIHASFLSRQRSQNATIRKKFSNFGLFPSFNNLTMNNLNSIIRDRMKIIFQEELEKFPTEAQNHPVLKEHHQAISYVQDIMDDLLEEEEK